MYKIKTKDNTTICTPADISLMTPYVLLEQEAWFEPETHFLPAFLHPGMTALDIGACFGVYTLTMAKAVGPEGQVFAFEPASQPREHLQAGADQNSLSNIHILPQALSSSSGKAKLTTPDTPELSTISDQASSQSEDIQLTTLDTWWNQAERPNIDFLKLDASGHEAQIIQGGCELFSKLSPVVLFCAKHGQEFNTQAAQDLTDLGYDLYQYLPGPGILARFDHNAQPETYLLNLLAAKPDTAARLQDQGLLAPEELEVPEPKSGLWRTHLAGLPWTMPLFSTWQRHADAQDSQDYLQALDFLCAAQNSDASRPQRMGQTQWAAQNLIRIHSEQPSGSTALSLSRALQALGQRQQAVQILDSLLSNLQANKRVNFNLPFLPPLARFDHMPIQESIQKWIMARCMESLIFLRSFSGYFSQNQDQKLLQTLHKNPERTLESHRRLALIGLRQGRKVAIKESSPLLMEGEENRNGWFWEMLSNDNRPPNFINKLTKTAQDKDRAGVVWIASYPKSGSTWIRFIVAGLMGYDLSNTQCVKNVIPDIHEVSNRKEILNNSSFAKTHFMFDDKKISSSNTKSAIYIVRNPFDVFFSGINWFNIRGIANIDQALDSFINAGGFTQFIKFGFGTWAKNALSWLNVTNYIDVLFLKYEDLLFNPKYGTEIINNFINANASQEIINNVAYKTSFDSLKERELEEKKYKRNSIFPKLGENRLFMNQGKVGNFCDKLSNYQFKRFINHFQEDMKRFGYDIDYYKELFYNLDHSKNKQMHSIPNNINYIQNQDVTHLISICIPTFNRADKLKRCLQYLQDRIHHLDVPYEVVISDNCSTDETSDIANLFTKLNIRYIQRDKNYGGFNNYAFSLAQGHGKYVCYLADDDTLSLKKIKEYLAYLEQNKDIDALYAPAAVYDLKNKKTTSIFGHSKEIKIFNINEHQQLLDYIIDNHLYPEIAIFKSDLFKKNLLRENNISYFAYVWPSEILRHGCIVFMSEPYYFWTIPEINKGDMLNLGHVHAMNEWDRFRGGLEYILSSFMSSLERGEQNRYLAKINLFTAKMIALAIRLRFQYNKGNACDLYSLSKRLIGMGYEHLLPIPLELIKVKSVTDFLNYDTIINNKNISNYYIVGTPLPKTQKITTQMNHFKYKEALPKTDERSLIILCENHKENSLDNIGNNHYLIHEKDLLSSFELT